MKDFQELLQPVIKAIADKPINKALGERLNAEFPADGPLFSAIEQACHAAIATGWMCAHGDEGRKFGRVIKPSSETGNLSVDVVQLNNVAGPHHSHPRGEVCMVMPQDEGATFDNNGAGWCTYAAGTSHFPTVRGGDALVLYLLPDGEIHFTGKTK